ncbi:Uncharacterised protein [uncultured Butyricicoccus sp.]|nr:Uncharacterised protein [uncultured Butyricicoccus sp.]
MLIVKRTLYKGNLRRSLSRVLQSCLLCLLQCDCTRGRRRSRGIYGCSRIARRRCCRVRGIKIRYFAANGCIAVQGNRLGRFVPGHRFAHDLPNRTDRQIDGAIVDRRIAHLAIHIIKCAIYPINNNRIVRLHCQVDSSFLCVTVWGAGCVAGRTGATDRRRIAAFIPVNIFIHQFANRPQRDIRRTPAADRMDLLPLHIVECTLHPVYLNPNIRIELRRYRIGAAGRKCGTAQQGCQRHRANHLFHFVVLPFVIIS